MNKIEQFAIRDEVKEKFTNSLEMFSFWDIIDECELTDEEKTWAKVHLTWDIRLCTSQEVETNLEELEAMDENQIVMEHIFRGADKNE
jgi:hypothetical protein